MSERILIIRLGALGDVANVMPAVAGLRRARPTDHLTWLVEEPPKGLVRIDRDVDDVIEFPRRSISRALRRPWLWPWVSRALWRITRDLRHRRFDRVLDFQGHLKSGLLAWSTRAIWRAGYGEGHGREGSHLFLNVHVSPPPEAVSRRERAAALARELDPSAEPEQPNLVVDPHDEKRVLGFLDTLAPGPRVVIHPGASRFGRFKRWPADRLGAVAERLAAERNAVVTVTHGPQESEATLHQLMQAAGGNATLAPVLSLPQLVALLRRADLFIGADSGPLHLAALVGTPCVAIFGPKDPAVYAPAGARVVRRDDLECSPCSRRTCPHLRCLLEITVEEVSEAAIEMLDSGTAAKKG